jgi:Fe2+/Zn2+ uptake regulation proteins
MSTTNDLLRAAGVKVTPGRVHVLEALLVATQAMSHADIEALLPDADRVTLYRVLDSLVHCGLALKAIDSRGVFRFTASKVGQEHGGHNHFRCTGCGGVFCLKAAPPPPPRLPHGFRLGAVELDISGTCLACNSAPHVSSP